MDQVSENTLAFCLNNWLTGSPLFKDSQSWLFEFRRELAMLSELKEEVHNLMGRVHVEIQTMLFRQGLILEEVKELLAMPPEALEIMESDGGVTPWIKRKRNSLS
jgi:hypothetical protein